MQFSDNIFVACLFASVICTLYSEILARINKIPVTVVLIPSVIPLIPGSSLYYAMSSLVQRDLEDGWFYGKLTFQYALGIALGISLVWTFWAVLFQRKNQPRDN